jgi:hypothetical protein
MSSAALKELNLPDAYETGERLAYAPVGLRVAVLVVLQRVEYGAELPVAGGLEVLQGRRCTGELRQASRQTRAFLGGQDAPGEEAEEIASIGVGVGFDLVF